jgi:hypothetical protein
MSAAPRLAFHWQSVVTSGIAMESSGGRIGIFNNPGTGYENFIAKDVISSGGIFEWTWNRFNRLALIILVARQDY